MDIFSSTDGPRELFLVEGQLAEDEIVFLEETHGFDTTKGVAGEIATPFRAQSYFSIGDPIVLPLAELLATSDEALPADIRLQLHSYEFWQIQLTCSFQAAPGCRFHDARFSLELQTVPIQLNTTTQGVQQYAIAYDLFPLKIEDECKINVKYTFNPEVKFDFNPVSSSLALPIYERAKEYVVYSSRIEAFDLQGTQPAWSFARTATHEISGPQKLFMIVRKPKGTQVKATFNLAARVQFMIGNIPLDPSPLVIVFRRQNPQSVITDATILLC